MNPLYRYMVHQFLAHTRSGARRRYLHSKFGTKFTRVQRPGTRRSSRSRRAGSGMR